MKKLFLLFLFSIILSISIVSAHPGNDLDSATGCHVCTTNCSDYGLIAGEFHCHQTTLDYEIQAIQSYYSSRGFGRSSAADTAIEQARLRFANQGSLGSTIVPTYTIPTYIPSSSISTTLSDNYDNMWIYLDLARVYSSNADYTNALSNLNLALIYARDISTERESDILELIEDSKAMQNDKSLGDLYCGFGGLYSDGRCVCYEDFTPRDETCVYTKYLEEELANRCPDNTYSLDNQCYCNSGYILSVDQTQCVMPSGSELDVAISWMYDNGLTKFTTPTTFMSDNGLRRDEAAKFFVKYAKEIMGMEPDISKTSCDFTDLDLAWSDLKDIIKESCQLGLFQGNDGKFMPTQKLTNAQAITVFIRLVDGKKDESGSHFANKYYEKAKDMGLLNGLDLNIQSKFDFPTTRGEVGRMLFRGKK